MLQKLLAEVGGQPRAEVLSGSVAGGDSSDKRQLRQMLRGFVLESSMFSGWINPR